MRFLKIPTCFFSCFLLYVLLKLLQSPTKTFKFKPVNWHGFQHPSQNGHCLTLQPHFILIFTLHSRHAKRCAGSCICVLLFLHIVSSVWNILSSPRHSPSFTSLSSTWEINLASCPLVHLAQLPQAGFGASPLLIHLHYNRNFPFTVFFPNWW